MLKLKPLNRSGSSLDMSKWAHVYQFTVTGLPVSRPGSDDSRVLSSVELPTNFERQTRGLLERHVWESRSRA